MKKIIFGLIYLTSASSFASEQITKYVGTTSEGKKCSLNYRFTEKTEGSPMVVARVKSKSRKGVSIETGRHWFDEQIERQTSVGGDLEYVEFEKDGMTELCDYYNICWFQKPLKTISVSYNSDSTPISYKYTTIKNWKDDAKLKTIIKCYDLKKVN